MDAADRGLIPSGFGKGKGYPMKRRIFGGVMILCLVCAFLTSCKLKDQEAGPGGSEPGDVIHTIDQLNKAEPVLNDHADDWDKSSLEPNFRQYTEVTGDRLRIREANYPRIKKVADDRYLLFYQDARVAQNIYYSVSSDLKEWGLGLTLFTSRSITVNGESDTLCYSTCDAAVLQNGDILAVASFRSSRNFRRTNEFNGLAMRVSSDGGRTWGEEQIIYKGSNWEPQILQLPSGEIQVYFTHGGPKIQPQMEAGIPTSQMVPSSGTAIIRSFDGGKTWDPYVMEPPYAAHRVSQQYAYTKNGIQVFTDQMPCAILLNNSDTIALAMESLFVRDGQNVLYITTAYSDDNWAIGLGIDEEGPADKQENLWHGAAPYLRQFPSGETILSYNQKRFQIRLGDSLARRFGDPLFPLNGTGRWGSLELIQSHIVVGTMAYVFEDKSEQNRIMISQNVLNHRIDAPRATMQVDGLNQDWADATDALFVGSDSQCQTAVRPAADDSRLYILVETLDDRLSEGDAVDLYLGDSVSDSLSASSLRLTVGPHGLVSAARFDGSDFAEIDIGQIQAAVTLQGTVGNDEDEDTGYMVEVAVPRSLLSISDQQLRWNVVLRDQETDGGVMEDIIGTIRWNVPGDWMPLTVS